MVYHAVQRDASNGKKDSNFWINVGSARRPVAGGRLDFAGASAETQRQLSLRPGEHDDCDSTIFRTRWFLPTRRQGELQ
jgi:hypothetical protein